MNVEMLVHDTVVAFVANPKSCESLYLIQIREEEKEKTEDVEDERDEASWRGGLRKEVWSWQSLHNN